MQINDDPLIEVIARAESEFYREPLNSFASLPAALAAAVRSFMGSEIGPLVLYHETGGHEGDGSDGSVKRARAALSAAIGEDIGGGRG